MIGFREFAEAHPLRIDLPDGLHVRFAGRRCAADTAIALRKPIWDEEHEREISLEEAVRIRSGRVQ